MISRQELLFIVASAIVLAAPRAYENARTIEFSFSGFLVLEVVTASFIIVLFTALLATYRWTKSHFRAQ